MKKKLIFNQRGLIFSDTVLDSSCNMDQFERYYKDKYEQNHQDQGGQDNPYITPLRNWNEKEANTSDGGSAIPWFKLSPYFRNKISGRLHGIKNTSPKVRIKRFLLIFLISFARSMRARAILPWTILESQCLSLQRSKSKSWWIRLPSKLDQWLG